MTQCSESVGGQGRWPRYHPCTRPAVVEREGKPFCAQHDPERKKAQEDKATAKWKAESAYKSRRVDLPNFAKAWRVGSASDGSLTVAIDAFIAAEAECQAHQVQMWKLY